MAVRSGSCISPSFKVIKMSLFQCDKCGCLENTALTRCSHCSYLMNREFEEEDKNSNTYKALQSYREILGLKDGEEFGHYCSACCPVWFHKDGPDRGSYGIGPNPEPKADKWDGGGLWHGEFERIFLPKGQFFTNRDGNLAHKQTKSTDIS